MRKTSKQMIAVFMTLVMLLTMTAFPTAAENDYVAEVGGIKYETLAEAIEAIGVQGETVTLLRDAEGSGVVINVDFTLDLNGFTYTFTEPAVGSTGTESNGFQILAGNDVTIMNGTLEVAPEYAEKYYILVQNYANLTVSSVVLDGTYLDKWSLTDGDSYVLSNNCGTVLIEDCTIIANDEGKLAFAFDACKNQSYAIPNVYASNCTVTGMVEVTGGNLTVDNGTYKPTAQCTDAFIVSSGNLTLNGDVQVTGGEIDGSTAVWALGTGEVAINDGTYTFVMPVSEEVVGGYNDLIYVKENASVAIFGGHFSGPARNSDGTHFLLNKKDADNVTATITVKGGTFVNFNPADTNTEPAGANDNFVADGYCVNAKETGSVNDVKTYDYTVGYHKPVHKDATAATCTEGGMEEHWYCESCGNYYKSEDATESTPVDDFVTNVIPHTFTKTEAKEATCVDGNKAYWYCSACNLYYLSDVDDFSGFSESLLKLNTSIPATKAHTMTKVEGVEPTCGQSGYNPYYYCSSCELYYLTEDGKYAGFESEEEAKSEATRAPFGDHTLVEVPAVEPTCTEDGLEFHWRCSVCEAGRMYNPEIPQPIHNKTTFEKFILPNLVIPATGEHTMTKVEGVEPTCGKSGHDPYWYCSVCDLCYATEDGEYQGYTKEEVLGELARPATADHTLKEVPAVAPTCTEDGCEAYWQCSVCGKCSTAASGQPVHSKEIFNQHLLPTLVIPAAGEHTMTKVEGVEPTCGKSGHDPYWYCSVCDLCYATEDGEYQGYTKEEVLGELARPATADHTLKEVPAVAPTCTEDGCKAYWQCSVCGKCSTAASGQPVHAEQLFKDRLLPTLIIPASGSHADLTKVEAVAPTYTEEGNIEYYSCACGALFTDAEGTIETTEADVILPRLIEIKEETADITSGAVDTAIEEAETEEIVIDLVEVAEDDTPATETTPVIEAATLPVASLEKVAEISEEATLTVNMTEVSVTMDSKTMAAVAEQSEGETLTLKVEKVETETLSETQQAAVEDKEVAVVITATMMSNNTAISDFKGGVVTIAVPFTIPAGAKAEDFQVYYLDDKGNLTAHETKYENGCLVFSTTHFSDYVIVNTAAEVKAPDTGANENVAIYAVAVVFAMTAMVSLVLGKKKTSF